MAREAVDDDGVRGGASALVLRGLRRRFGATIALDGVDLRVGAGEIHALLGENGAGKSTLVNVLAGIVAPDAGAMTLFGAPYAPSGPRAARRAGIAMIHQELANAPHLTVAENMLLGDEPRRLGFVRRGELRRRAAAALAELGRGDIDVDARLGSLALAERQLVEIARAVALGCRVLVLDEPTSALGRPDVERLFALLRRLRAQGCAIVHISHFLEEVLAIADRYTVLRDGRTVAEGPIEGATTAALATAMVGRPIDGVRPRPARAAGEVLLEIDRLRGGRLPREASLVLRRGEVVGIAGLVGAGRTELLRAVFALDPVRSGRVRILVGGGATGRSSPHGRWRAGIGLVAEDRRREGLLQRRSILENITATRLRPFERTARLAADCRPWIDRLGIRCRGPRQRVAALSGGNQQKVALAQLLRHGCDVLLLDEPTRGVDVGARAAMHGIIDEIATGGDGRPPRGVLMTSSSPPELLAVCDRIAVMHRGVLGEARPVAEWNEHRLMLASTGAEAARR